MENAFRNKVVCRILGWLFCVLCIVSCRQEETTGLDEEVTVTVRLSSPGVMVESRGVADDPKNTTGSWSTEELLVDGSRLYRVTLLVVDSNNKLVGMKDWNNLPLQTSVSAEFKKLKSNTTYRMIAVANYSAYTYSENKSWAGLPNFPDLTGLTLGENISNTITALNGYSLTDANSDRVAAKQLQPQPLSLVKQFTTSSSSTIEVDAELLRTYARVRISITNRSEDLKLSVDGLRFGSTSSLFGRNDEPLLPVGDNSIRVADGNVSVTSGDAIIPFNSSNFSALGEGSSGVAFDGYIYECKNTDGLNFSLDLKYPLPDISYDVYKKGSQANSITSGKLYMIKCGNNYYLSVKNHQLVAIPIAASETTFRTANAIWYITKNGNNYLFQSAENTSSYIKLSNNKVELSTEQVPMLLSNDKKIYKSFNNTPYYLYVENGAVYALKDNSTTFTFYSVSIETKTDNVSARTVTVPLRTIADGVSSPTSMIRRNDFFNVLVSVNYNKITGGFEYKIQNWGTGGGNVEFN